jgi:hypothetical protein
LCKDEQKAAVFYEAYRRCKALQDAWLKGKSGAKAMVTSRWQIFVATVLDHLPQTWIQLPLFLRKAITMQQLPEMLPPVGYSVWPSEPFFFDPQAIPPKDDFETQEEYKEHWQTETRDQFHERCRNLAAKIVGVPPVQLRHAGPLLHELKKLADDGFVIVAINNKSAEAFNYAIRFLQRNLKRERSYRIADLFWQWRKRADAKIEESEGIQRAWAERRAIGKRVKRADGGRLILEEKVFNFRELCKGLEGYDETQTPSNLMKRLRLGCKKETL